MSPEDLLGGLANISTILGFGVQIAGLTGKEDRNVISLKAFQSIITVAFRWKRVHKLYHILLNDIRVIDEYCLGMSKEDISPGTLKKLLKGLRTLEQKSPTFRRDIDVYIDQKVRRSISSAGGRKSVMSKIAKELGQVTAKKVEETFNAQNDAVRTHDSVCNNLEQIAKLSSLDFDRESIDQIYHNMKPLYKSFNSVILHTDTVLINTIDFYEIVNEFAK